METSSKQNRCPKCQTPVPAEAPQGLCPKCVLAAVSTPTESGAPPETKSPPPPLEVVVAAFPQLEILELIAQGGMGLVYRARQPKLDRFVALKLLPQAAAADPAFAERFNREARLLARLSHPNIVTVHDFGHCGGFFYLLMEFVDGVNLRQAMRAGRFSPAEALALVPKICEALQYAHDEGVMHRDIKPENILLDTRGRVKIADFGIAKLLGETSKDFSLTASGAAVGTPHYMAPEQLERPHDVDHRADIYSLGVVFYEMLTGELPIGRFAPPSEKVSMDPRVDGVVFRALEKERERRYQSAGDVKTSVEGITATPATPQPVPPLVNPTMAAWPTPAWVNRAGILFTILGLVAFLPTITTFGGNVHVVHSGALLILTGIALLTRHWRWRIAGLIGNTIGVVFTVVSFTAFFLKAIGGGLPIGWQIGVAGVPNSAEFAIVLGIIQAVTFVAGLWILCRPDVKALFGLRPDGGGGGQLPPVSMVSQSGYDTLLLLGVPVLLVGLVLGAYYLARRPNPAETNGLNDRTAAAQNELGTTSTKTITLGRFKIEERNISVQTASAILPGESVVAVLRNLDGRMEEALTTTYTVRHNGAASTSTIFTWQVPEPFGLDFRRSAILEGRGYAGESMVLEAGKPRELFTVWKKHGVAGDFLAGYVEFKAAPLKAEGSSVEPNRPVRAVVRIESATHAPGILIASLSPVLPPGHVLQGVGVNPDGDEGETHTTSGRAAMYNSLSCRWNFPENFGTAHLQAAANQLERLKERGPVLVAPGERQLVFAVTNQLGEIQRGFLELVGPSAATPR